jgi:hypothetical protein
VSKSTVSFWLPENSVETPWKKEAFGGSGMSKS